MKERMSRLVDKSVTDELNMVGTFHKVALKLLRQYADNLSALLGDINSLDDPGKYNSDSKNAIGMLLGKNFTIYDNDESVNIIKKLMAAEDLDEKVYYSTHPYHPTLPLD